MTHYMLDLETMGTRPGCAIVSIGVVQFDEQGIKREFYDIVDLDSCINAGLRVEGDTVLWWLRQPDEVRKEIGAAARDLPKVLLDVSTFIRECPSVVWGNGAAFDNIILRAAYEAVGHVPPWTTREDRCYRTMKAMYRDVPLPQVQGNVKHRAVDDAKVQALHLIEIARVAGVKL